nr:MAG TPA: tail completion protein [Caudoviricetes sp.]
MGTRIELQHLLEELFGSKEVYYQPPETIKMSYPSIVYEKVGLAIKKANDGVYKKDKRYSIVVIDKRPDNPVIDKILELPMASYDRHYVADNLNHDALTLYF